MQGGELINLTEPVTDPKTGITSDADTLYWMAGDNSAKRPGQPDGRPDDGDRDGLRAGATRPACWTPGTAACRKHVLNPSVLDSSGPADRRQRPRPRPERLRLLRLRDPLQPDRGGPDAAAASSTVWPGGTRPTVSRT